MTDQEYFNESLPFNRPECDNSITVDLIDQPLRVWTFACTRPLDHTGICVACSFHSVEYRWSTDYQPLPNFLLC